MAESPKSVNARLVRLFSADYRRLKFLWKILGATNFVKNVYYYFLNKIASPDKKQESVIVEPYKAPQKVKKPDCVQGGCWADCEFLSYLQTKFACNIR
jgi:hypothetical protein